MNYKIVEIDGNDWVWKTTRVQVLQRMYPELVIKDRWLLSELTLHDEYFSWNYDIWKLEWFRKDTLYILLTNDIGKCKNRLKERWSSLKEKYHTDSDLAKYNDRFTVLSQNKNIHTINTDNFDRSIEEICTLIDGTFFNLENMHKIYLWWNFCFQYKDFSVENAKKDYRAKILEDLDLFLYKKDGIPAILDRNTIYNWPFYFYTNEMTADDVVWNEIQMTENCTDAFFILTGNQCPWTITEIIHTSMLGKNVYIYYVTDNNSYWTPENEINSPCRYPIIFSKRYNKNTHIKQCDSIDECVKEIKNVIKSFSN